MLNDGWTYGALRVMYVTRLMMPVNERCADRAEGKPANRLD